MPVTRGTRRGNGPGHGGPAKGAGHRMQRSGDPVSDAARTKGGKVRPGGGKTTVADVLIELGAREVAAEAWMAILRDPAHPHHATMVAKVADRMDGMPIQPVDASVKRAEIKDRPLSEDEWLTTYGMGAADRPAESAD